MIRSIFILILCIYLAKTLNYYEQRFSGLFSPQETAGYTCQKCQYNIQMTSNKIIFSYSEKQGMVFAKFNRKFPIMFEIIEHIERYQIESDERKIYLSISRIVDSTVKYTIHVKVQNQFQFTENKSLYSYCIPIISIIYVLLCLLIMPPHKIFIPIINRKGTPLSLIIHLQIKQIIIESIFINLLSTAFQKGTQTDNQKIIINLISLIILIFYQVRLFLLWMEALKKNYRLDKWIRYFVISICLILVFFHPFYIAIFSKGQKYFYLALSPLIIEFIFNTYYRMIPSIRQCLYYSITTLTLLLICSYYPAFHFEVTSSKYIVGFQAFANFVLMIGFLLSKIFLKKTQYQIVSYNPKINQLGPQLSFQIESNTNFGQLKSTDEEDK